MLETFLERLQPVVCLPGLLLVVALLVVALVCGRQARAWLLPAAIPLSLLTLTCPISVNAMVYIGGFQAIAMTGTGGIGVVSTLGTAACQALLNGAVGLVVSLCLVAVVYAMVGVIDPEPTTPTLRSPASRVGLVFSLAVAVITLAVGLLVWLHHDAVRAIIAVSAPNRPPAAPGALGVSNIGAILETIARDLQALRLGGVSSSVVLVVLAVVAFVVLFRRKPLTAGTLVAAGAALVAVLGAGWTAVALSADLQELDRVNAATAAADAGRGRGPESDAFLQPLPPPSPPPPPGAVATQPEEIPDRGAGGVAGGVEGGVVGGIVGGVVGGLPEAPPPSGSAQPVRVGGSIKVPVKTKHVEAVYPAIAQSARIEGLVIIEARIGPDGKVKDAKILRSVPLLDQAALDAVRQWEYVPTLINGTAVPVVMTVTVTFKLK